MTPKPSPSPKVTPNPDINQSFFRAWALRSSEESHSDDISVSHKTPPTSPRTDPSQRTAKRGSRKPVDSEGSLDQALNQGNAELSSTVFPVGSGTAQEEPPFPNTRKSSESVVSRRRDSTGNSSVSSRARRLFGIVDRRPSSSSQKEIQPPRVARSGYVWNRETSGHWLETRIGTMRFSARRSQQTSAVTSPGKDEVVLSLSRQQFPESSGAGGADVPFNADDPEKSDMQRLEEKLGIYCRVKRRLGLTPKRTPESEWDNSEHQERRITMTGEVLDYASSLLRELAEKRMGPPSPSASASIASIAGTYSRRPGRLPHSLRSYHSSTSSIREIMRGRAPVSTPDSDALYTGPDDRQYFRVDMMHPDSPTCLPSEARRVGTPPMPTRTPDGRLRGFFFDYRAPDDEMFTPLEDLKSHRVPAGEKLALGPEIDWFRVKVSDIADDTDDEFELNVPEHLPSSPLCPKNPKHPSGGTGICVYHGRNRTISLH
ncbi:hypothetical protein MMC24_003341 [Lignoscripta atroalba]|nr:hypothetical protein [Lignoscripta atroalba]